MVGGAEFSQRGGAHQLEKAQAGLAVFLPFKVCILLGQNGVPGISDGAVSLDVGIQHTVQVRGISPELFQVAVCLIAGEGRRHHKRGMAEQIVLHVRLVNNLIFCAVEDVPDQLFIGGCTRQLPDGDLFQVDGDHPVSLPMPGRKRKGKQDVLFRQCRRQRPRLHIVPHKNDVLRPIRPQRVQNGIQLCIAQDHKDHIVHCIRCKFSHHRNAADRGAERKFVLDPQAILLDLRSPVSPGKQGHILSGVKQIPCQIAP